MTGAGGGRGGRIGAGAMALFALLAGAGACTVGDGAGSAIGPLFEIGDCHYPESRDGDDHSIGSPTMPEQFTLAPTFFAGEPIDDITPGPKANRLLIRMQRWGTSIDVNDTLYIDVQNSFEVARCIRGRTVNGVPDWDARGGWCDWSGGLPATDGGTGDGAVTDAAGGVDADVDGAVDAGAPAGGDAGPAPAAMRARIHVGSEELVRGSLALLFSCHPSEGPVNLVGVGVDGWVEFIDFGDVTKQADRPSDQRDPIDQSFKADFGNRLRANFHLVLGDERVVTAIKLRDPIPDPLIGGQLDGFFDFFLERGRAAQPFP